MSICLFVHLLSFIHSQCIVIVTPLASPVMSGLPMAFSSPLSFLPAFHAARSSPRHRCTNEGTVASSFPPLGRRRSVHVGDEGKQIACGRGDESNRLEREREEERMMHQHIGSQLERRKMQREKITAVVLRCVSSLAWSVYIYIPVFTRSKYRPTRWL